ncbi:MAG: arginyltransferase [Spirochaetes bacterium]|nr:arginyltransferase [Spirochaetota bacterium]
MEYISEPCPYLGERNSRIEVLAGQQSEVLYECLLEEGWRRSGPVFYRNNCEGCSSCIPLRRPVSSPSSRRGRKLLKNNSDLKIVLTEPSIDEEHYSLYRKYMESRHGQTEEVAESLLALAASPLARFVEYRLGTGQLIALGFVDEAACSLSSAYFAFDPQESRRSLGSYSVFAETELAKSLGKSYYYLGFWVHGSPKMEYKADFPPFELLMTEGGGRRGWFPFASRSEALEVLHDGTVSLT